MTSCNAVFLSLWRRVTLCIHGLSTMLLAIVMTLQICNYVHTPDERTSQRYQQLFDCDTAKLIPRACKLLTLSLLLCMCCLLSQSTAARTALHVQFAEHWQQFNLTFAAEPETCIASKDSTGCDVSVPQSPHHTTI